MTLKHIWGYPWHTALIHSHVQTKGKPWDDGGFEPGRDFMPLPCVSPVFANSSYFSQESCQSGQESVASSGTKTVSFPSPEVNTRWCCHPPIDSFMCNSFYFSVCLKRALLESFVDETCQKVSVLPKDKSSPRTRARTSSNIPLAPWLKTSWIKHTLHESCKRDAVIYLSRTPVISHPGEKIPQGTISTAVISCDEMPGICVGDGAYQLFSIRVNATMPSKIPIGLGRKCQMADANTS